MPPGTDAHTFKLSLFLAWSISLPVIVGLTSPWVLIFPALMVILAVATRVQRVNAIRRHERGELGKAEK